MIERVYHWGREGERGEGGIAEEKKRQMIEKKRIFFARNKPLASYIAKRVPRLRYIHLSIHLSWMQRE